MSAKHALRPRSHNLPTHKPSQRRSNHQPWNHLPHLPLHFGPRRLVYSEPRRTTVLTVEPCYKRTEFVLQCTQPSLFRHWLRGLKSNLFQKLHLLLQFGFPHRKFVKAQQVRQHIRILLLGQLPQRTLWHRLANPVKQISHRKPVPIRKKRSTSQRRRPASAHERVPMAGSAFLPIHLLSPLSLLLRIHAIPNRPRSRRPLLRPSDHHHHKANHVGVQHSCAPSRQPTIHHPQFSGLTPQSRLSYLGDAPHSPPLSLSAYFFPFTPTPAN